MVYVEHHLYIILTLLCVFFVICFPSACFASFEWNTTLFFLKPPAFLFHSPHSPHSQFYLCTNGIHGIHRTFDTLKLLPCIDSVVFLDVTLQVWQRTSGRRYKVFESLRSWLLVKKRHLRNTARLCSSQKYTKKQTNAPNYWHKNNHALLASSMAEVRLQSTGCHP